MENETLKERFLGTIFGQAVVEQGFIMIYGKVHRMVKTVLFQNV